MKILMIASYLPYPLFSGGQVRLYNLIKELSLSHEITLICELRPSQTEKDIAEVKKICKNVITVARRKQWSITNVVKSVTSSHSFLLTGHTLPEMQDEMQEVLSQEKFDVIHVETYYVMQNLPATNIPVVLVEHNVEYKVYAKFKDRAPVPLRPFLALDIQKMRREEEYFWKQATKLVAVSNEDKAVMKQAKYDATLVSNGVNIDQFKFKFGTSSFAKASVSDAPKLQRRSADKEKRLLFIGDFKWIQNQDSVKFIINEVWPLLSEKLKVKSEKFHLKLWIVGRHIPESVRSLSDDPDVLFDEESSALPTPEIFSAAAVLLAPIRVGGGTSYKILESMSCGTPVVTMQLSADAIEAKDGYDIMVGNIAEALAEKTLELLAKESLYEKISRNGRILIEKNYTWKEIAKKLEEVYMEVKSEK